MQHNRCFHLFKEQCTLFFGETCGTCSSFLNFVQSHMMTQVCLDFLSVASLGLPCDSSLGKESTCNAGDPGSIPGSGRSAGEGVGCNTPVFTGFPRGSAGKESTCNAGDLGWEDPLEKGMAIYSQYSGLENSMDWHSWTRLSDFHALQVGQLALICFCFCFIFPFYYKIHY